jgi:hypothetical protein
MCKNSFIVRVCSLPKAKGHKTTHERKVLQAFGDSWWGDKLRKLSSSLIIRMNGSRRPALNMVSYTQTSCVSDRATAPELFSSKRSLMKLGMKHSFLMRLSSAEDRWVPRKQDGCLPSRQSRCRLSSSSKNNKKLENANVRVRRSWEN